MSAHLPFAFSLTPTPTYTLYGPALLTCRPQSPHTPASGLRPITKHPPPRVSRVSAPHRDQVRSLCPGGVVGRGTGSGRGGGSLAESLQGRVGIPGPPRVSWLVPSPTDFTLTPNMGALVSEIEKAPPFPAPRRLEP